MKNSIWILSFFLSINIVYGQDFILEKTSSKLSVKGTSTLHDWESKVEDFSCKTQFDGSNFDNLSFVAKVKSIKSGKSGMDKNTYAAMKEGSYPEITMTAQQLKISGNKIVGTVALKIAGSTQSIDVELNLENNSKIRVYGEIPLKMTTFGIDPPVAVFGTIKTGDDISVMIDFGFKKE